MNLDLMRFNRLTVRVTALLIVMVSLSILVMAHLSYTKLHEVTEDNASIRIDRAARAAASIFSHSLDHEFEIIRDQMDRPQAVHIVSETVETALTFRPEHDVVLKEIGMTNQGAANLFKLNPETMSFDRIATTFRRPDGSMPPPMSLSEGHPAYKNLIANKPFTGDVPVMGRLRLAYLTPIQSREGAVAGALAVDVGWVDDLHINRIEMQTLIIGYAIVILLLVVGVGVWQMTAELRPLKRLVRLANDLAAGKNTGDVPFTERSGEVGALAQGLSRVVEMQQKLSYLAYTDTLTGLGNRSRYLTDLREAVLQSKKGEREWMLLHINIDRFKDVNVAFGQSVGDTLLKCVAKAIEAVAGKEALIARLSADHFTVLLPQDGSGSTSSNYGDLLLRLCKPIELGSTEVHMSAAIGVVHLARDADTADDAHLKVDLALRQAKEDGGNCCAVFAEEMYLVLQSQIELERALREAIRKRAIQPYFQPQFDPSTNQLTGLEALARWHHKTKGMISPGAFIPIAESTGLIVDLGTLILDQTCSQARSWRDSGFDFKHLAVNVSPIQLLQPDFPHIVRGLLEKYELAGSNICLEVTENLFLDQDEGHVGSILDRLKALGLLISLDDFGSGYSSLGYLNRLPFDQLKVDRTFVMNVDKDHKNQQLLAGIVTLGHGLGLTIVAEGAETREEVDCVAKLGCNSVQGFAYAHPMPAKDIPAALKAIQSQDHIMTRRSA
ncbi:diguanylate cyclase/phosphodiesterase [Cohaesibacter sp. ES.047]|uniref:bifunctional diguanylate cyclase/phosphodiesterase n=1 Tax=Cohaesibacter sp. ES.047 TaxID=1798205 RepID=UPI000BBFAD79|nr:EAL domain-containing protein [Cohaesibacter sp. ES.047]SNY93108.1 diguanylate cyclase/phosphodiesterase [Cohaesibacter sp. ES.047]